MLIKLTFKNTFKQRLFHFLLVSLLFTWKTCRSSHRRCSVRKGVLRNFTKFTGKRLCWFSFLIKLQALNFIKKENLTQVFSCEFCKISKNTFFKEYPRETASRHETYWSNSSIEHELLARLCTIRDFFSLWSFLIESFAIELYFNNILSVINLFLPLNEKEEWVGQQCLPKISYFIKIWLNKLYGLKVHLLCQLLITRFVYNTERSNRSIFCNVALFLEKRRPKPQLY